MSEHTCEGLVRGDRWQRCGKRAAIERDGAWYCRVHDPVTRRQRREKQDAIWAAEDDVRGKIAQARTLELGLAELCLAHLAELPPDCQRKGDALLEARHRLAVAKGRLAVAKEDLKRP